MAKCKSCGAEIVWIETVRGAKIPCDPEQIMYRAKTKGPLKIVTLNGEVISGERGKWPEPVTGIGYISHFATCPNADYHRQRGIKTEGR